jgi:hypothetical protein
VALRFPILPSDIEPAYETLPQSEFALSGVQVMRCTQTLTKNRYSH